MKDAYANVSHHVFSAAVAIALACSLCPAAAFASAGNLSADAASGIQSADAGVLTTQAASKAKSAKKTTKKSAAFAIKKYKTVKKYGGITAKFTYGKPVLKGKTKIVKKINSSLEKRYETALASKNDVLRYAKYDSAYGRSGAYVALNSTTATYNGKGLISFRYAYSWFAGGVANNGLRGDVFSLKTGKKVDISQVVSGTASQVKEKIAAKAAKKYNQYVGDALAASLEKKNMSDVGFYLNNGKVTVIIEPYTVPGQRSALTVTLQGNYA